VSARATDPPRDEDDVRRPSNDGWGLLLPAAWWTIDLRDKEARRGSVAGLVDRQVGRADDRAGLRHDLRKRLDAVAEQAAAAGGRLMAVSLMRVGEIPVPATMTVYRLADDTDLVGQGLHEIEAVIGAEPGSYDALEMAEGPGGPVLRRVTRRPGPEDLGAAAIEMLVADYWLDPDDGKGLLTFAFSTPLIHAREPFLELFDAIVASVEFDDAA